MVPAGATLFELMRAARHRLAGRRRAGAGGVVRGARACRQPDRIPEGFALTVAAMATPAALERVAFEAAEDALAQGCVLAEFRIAPLLFEAHGVAPDATGARRCWPAWRARRCPAG
jgi:adenosine deaminase